MCHGQCGGSLPCNKALVLRGSCVRPPVHPPGTALASPRRRTALLLPCSVLSPSSCGCSTPRRCCSPTPCPCPTAATGQRPPCPACAAATRACASRSIYRPTGCSSAFPVRGSGSGSPGRLGRPGAGPSSQAGFRERAGCCREGASGWSDQALRWPEGQVQPCSSSRGLWSSAGMRFRQQCWRGAGAGQELLRMVLGDCDLLQPQGRRPRWGWWGARGAAQA